MNVARLKGNNINLCPIRTDDIAIKEYEKWINDEEISHLIGRNYKIAGFDAEKKWAESAAETKHGEYPFNIVERSTDTLIGNCGISVKDNGVTGVLGILIGSQKHRGIGYGKEVMRMLVRFAFDELRVHRVELTVLADNEQAYKCYLTAGFQKCGERHEAAFHAGKYHDQWIMELTEEDYRVNEVYAGMVLR